MNITVAVAVFALLYILTVTFINVGQELKRDLPREELSACLAQIAPPRDERSARFVRIDQ